MDWDQEVTTGTTILAVEFDGGVVIAADSRTTSGSYIVNRVTDKLTRVTDRIYCCRSGSAADTQAVADIISYKMALLKSCTRDHASCTDELNPAVLCCLDRTTTGREPTVKSAASAFRGICYQNRDSLTAGIICAGWDEREGGQVFVLPLGGMCVRQPFAMGGSGSTYLFGHVDATFRVGMTKEECLKWAADAITLAIERDGSSGGCVRLAAITKDGLERHVILNNELTKFYQD
eukprot:m.291235 g.291235  ORF g.291235 m.291235 type:complete len:234 (+) comp55093_c0_seq5:2793-3494(+)